MFLLCWPANKAYSGRGNLEGGTCIIFQLCPQDARGLHSWQSWSLRDLLRQVQKEPTCYGFLVDCSQLMRLGCLSLIFYSFLPSFFFFLPSLSPSLHSHLQERVNRVKLFIFCPERLDCVPSQQDEGGSSVEETVESYKISIICFHPIPSQMQKLFPSALKHPSLFLILWKSFTLIQSNEWLLCTRYHFSFCFDLGSPYVVQGVLKLTIVLSQPLKNWEHGHPLLCPTSNFLWTSLISIFNLCSKLEIPTL